MACTKIIANSFIKKYSTNEQPLNKAGLYSLVLHAHGWHMVHTGKKLIHDKIVWNNIGVVIPILESGFYQRSRTPDYYAVNYGVLNKSTKILLECVYQSYKHLTMDQLSSTAKHADSPWAHRATHNGKREITENDIRKICSGY